MSRKKRSQNVMIDFSSRKNMEIIKIRKEEMAKLEQEYEYELEKINTNIAKKMELYEKHFDEYVKHIEAIFSEIDTINFINNEIINTYINNRDLIDEYSHLLNKEDII